MKKLLFLVVGLLLALPLGAAEPVHHPEQHQNQVVKPDDQQFQTHMRHMDDHLKLMREQMAKLNATTDPKQRQQLKIEYMESMRAGMRMLGDMPACPMMGSAKGGMMGGGMMGGCMMMGGQMGPMMNKTQGAKQAKADAVKPGMMCQGCQQMMHMRLQMMQAVIEGLLENQK